MRLVFSHVLWARCVLLSLPFLAPWANFLGAQLKPPAKGRRTPWSAAGPLASLPRFEPAPAPFAACRYVGQAILPGNLACSRLSGGYSRQARLFAPSRRCPTKTPALR